VLPPEEGFVGEVTPGDVLRCSAFVAPEMTQGRMYVWAARASTLPSLRLEHQRFDDGTDVLADHGTKQPAQHGGKLKATKPIWCGGLAGFWNPH